nr:patatin-like phospholipase family protein [Rhizobium leguminosarum]
MGAVTGGLIAGNRPEQRLARLRSFWELAAEEDMIFLPFTQTAGRTGKKRSVLTTLFAGRPGLFRPSAPGIWSVLPFGFTDESVLNTDPQRETLTRLIDFDLLGGGMVPLIVTAVDIETGEEVAFDSRRGSLTLDHIMASTAFPVVFPPVTIGDRTFFDPGIVSNLPLLTLFSKEPQEEVLCICLDLSPQRGQVPTSLDETVRRATDVLFGSQSRRVERADNIAPRARRAPNHGHTRRVWYSIGRSRTENLRLFPPVSRHAVGSGTPGCAPPPRRD